jgi:hypothetical protein
MVTAEEFVYNAVNNWIPGEDVNRHIFLKID